MGRMCIYSGCIKRMERGVEISKVLIFSRRDIREKVERISGLYGNGYVYVDCKGSGIYWLFRCTLRSRIRA